MMVKETDIEENQNKLKRLLQALIKAEEFLNANEEDSKQVVMSIINADSVYMDYQWPKQDFEVNLDQALLLKLEDQARWRLSNGLSTGEFPNYLDHIYIDALDEVDSSKVGLIR